MSSKKKPKEDSSDEGLPDLTHKKKVRYQKALQKETPAKRNIPAEDNKVYQKDASGNIYIITPTKKKEIIYTQQSDSSSNHPEGTKKGTFGGKKKKGEKSEAPAPEKKATIRRFAPAKTDKAKGKTRVSVSSSSSGSSSEEDGSSSESSDYGNDYSDEDNEDDDGAGSTYEAGDDGDKDSDESEPITKKRKITEGKSQHEAAPKKRGSASTSSKHKEKKTKSPKDKGKKKGADDGETGKKKKRNKRWNRDENSCLVHNSISRWDFLKGKFKSGSCGIEDRDRSWAEVTAEVNSVTNNKRSVRQCKKKLGYLQSAAREKNRKLQQKTSKTGAGGVSTRDMLEDFEEALLQKMGVEYVTGVPSISRAPVKPGEELQLATPPKPKKTKTVVIPSDADEPSCSKKYKKKLSYKSDAEDSDEPTVKQYKKSKIKVKKKKKAKADDDSSSAEVSSTTSDVEPIKSDSEAGVQTNITDHESPLHITTLVTPKKEKFTIIVDNKMNVIHQFPGSPKYSPVTGFKKGGVGVKNQGFYIVQKKEDSDLEEIEDPALSAKQEFDDAPPEDYETDSKTGHVDTAEDVLKQDISEVAETTGLIGITDLTAKHEVSKELPKPREGSEEYKYDENLKTAEQVLKGPDPGLSVSSTSSTVPPQEENVQQPPVPRATPVLDGERRVQCEEHTVCTKLETVLEQQTGILQGILFLFKTKVKEVDEKASKKEQETPPKIVKIIEEQHAIIAQQTKMLKKQDELLEYHRECFDRMGAILKKVCVTHDMTADMSVALAQTFIDIAKGKEPGASFKHLSNETGEANVQFEVRESGYDIQSSNTYTNVSPPPVFSESTPDLRAVENLTSNGVTNTSLQQCDADSSVIHGDNLFTKNEGHGASSTTHASVGLCSDDLPKTIEAEDASSSQDPNVALSPSLPDDVVNVDTKQDELCTTSDIQQHTQVENQQTLSAEESNVPETQTMSPTGAMSSPARNIESDTVKDNFPRKHSNENADAVVKGSEIKGVENNETSHIVQPENLTVEGESVLHVTEDGNEQSVSKLQDPNPTCADSEGQMHPSDVDVSEKKQNVAGQGEKSGFNVTDELTEDLCALDLTNADQMSAFIRKHINLPACGNTADMPTLAGVSAESLSPDNPFAKYLPQSSTEQAKSNEPMGSESKETNVSPKLSEEKEQADTDSTCASSKDEEPKKGRGKRSKKKSKTDEPKIKYETRSTKK